MLQIENFINIFLKKTQNIHLFPCLQNPSPKTWLTLTKKLGNSYPIVRKSIIYTYVCHAYMHVADILLWLCSSLKSHKNLRYYFPFFNLSFSSLKFLHIRGLHAKQPHFKLQRKSFHFFSKVTCAANECNNNSNKIK